MSDRFAIVAFAAVHDRENFDCGVPTLNRYLAAQASQDRRRNIANCFVATPLGSSRIAGYYTLSAGAINASDIPEEILRRLPRYPNMPAALIGRLAVDRDFHGQGLGGALMDDAARRAANSDPAVFAILVDAKDENAAAFYRHYQFIPLTSDPMALFLPISFFRRLSR